MLYDSAIGRLPIRFSTGRQGALTDFYTSRFGKMLPQYLKMGQDRLLRTPSKLIIYKPSATFEVT
jgi:hypothetical protein